MKKVLVIYMESAKNVLFHVKKTLERYNVHFIARERNHRRSSDFKNKDLIIVVGGDGTFLRTAHFVNDNTLLLGVNANPRKKEGFFMFSTPQNFEKHLKIFLDEKSKYIDLTRLETTLGKKKLELSLNEVYIGSKKPYDVTRYDLRIGKKTECQKSSGVLVAAPAGSYAWIKSAGGKKLPLSSKKFQYLVREPYIRKLTKSKLLKGVLTDQTVEITSLTDDNIVIVDSLSREYSFKKGHKLKIKRSDKNLRVVL